MEKKTGSVPVPAPDPTATRKGKKPWEMTIEEAEREGEELRATYEEADRIASPLFESQLGQEPLPTVRKGRKPWEMTLEEVQREAEELRERFAEADRVARPLFIRQLAPTDDSED